MLGGGSEGVKKEEVDTGVPPRHLIFLPFEIRVRAYYMGVELRRLIYRRPSVLFSKYFLIEVLLQSTNSAFRGAVRGVAAELVGVTEIRR